MSLAATINRSQRDREGWKYTSLKPLMDVSFDAPVRGKEKLRVALPSIVAEAAQRHQITFINGEYRPEYSKLGELEGVLKGDAESGYSLRLAGQTCLVTAPIELVFVVDADKPTEINTRLSIELGASTRLTLIEHHVAAEKSAAVAALYDTEIHLGPQAKLVHGKIISGGSEVSSIAETRVMIEEGAYYDNFVFIAGGKLVRNEIEARLKGKLAQCALNGVMLLRDRQHADTTTHIIHEAPFGTSREKYKSVIADKSRGVFQGRITVEKHAQKADSSQLSRALLLSDQAEIDSKPELKIYADDVKCNHGAAIGALDADAMFYLRARGLDENAARGLLIRGFIEEALDEIHMPEWRDFCRGKAEAWCDEQD